MSIKTISTFAGTGLVIADGYLSTQSLGIAVSTSVFNPILIAALLVGTSLSFFLADWVVEELQGSIDSENKTIAKESVRGLLLQAYEAYKVGDIETYESICGDLSVGELDWLYENV